MFYFILKFLFYLILIFSTLYIFKLKEITILEIIILIIILNIDLYSLYTNLNIIYTFLLYILVIISYYLYLFLENKTIKENNILINRGIINFNNLIKENMTYNNLLFSLKKKGINNPGMVDYCIKRGNNLIVIPKNTIGEYPISIIVDGKVIKDNLFSINKTREWLDKKIKDNNLSLININYAYYKNKNIYFITL
ncbi:MAG: DUF421 domain-containing protein [Erysipelotrichaceae bacterium]|nr:DUF421 domain-containing protein [Erysipelotrichaceae bacterium]